MLTEKELCEVINDSIGHTMTLEEVASVIREVDYLGNAELNYSEFLAATMETSSFLDDNRLQAIFNVFDTSHSGKISEDDLYYAMQKLGIEIAREETIKIVS